MTDKEIIRNYIESLHSVYRGSRGDIYIRRVLRTILYFIDNNLK